MPPRNRPAYEANRQTRWLLAEVGRELRLSRIGAGMRQRDVARLTETSVSRICRVEQGRVQTLRLSELGRHAAAVGLKPYVRLFPAARRLLDEPQLALLGRLKARLHPRWTWETEVPMSIEADLRAADARISIQGCSVVAEAYTRFRDYQAQSRAALIKKRDLGADRLILLLNATRANRQAIRQAGEAARGAFPLDTKALMASLAAGQDPGADGIAFL